MPHVQKNNIIVFVLGGKGGKHKNTTEKEIALNCGFVVSTGIKQARTSNLHVIQNTSTTFITENICVHREPAWLCRLVPSYSTTTRNDEMEPAAADRPPCSAPRGALAAPGTLHAAADSRVPLAVSPAVAKQRQQRTKKPRDDERNAVLTLYF